MVDHDRFDREAEGVLREYAQDIVRNYDEENAESLVLFCADMQHDVAAALRECDAMARAEEREACALLCDQEVVRISNDPPGDRRAAVVAGICAVRIRARSRAQDEQMKGTDR